MSLRRLKLSTYEVVTPGGGGGGEEEEEEDLLFFSDLPDDKHIYINNTPSDCIEHFQWLSDSFMLTERQK
jgi:hypothetical protein